MLVRINQLSIGTATIDSIPPLAQRVVEFSWAGQSTRYSVIVDPDDKITESDEDNNEALKSIS